MTLQEKIRQESTNSTRYVGFNKSEIPYYETLSLMEKYFIKGANFIADLLRWRDVNEELPPINTHIIIKQVAGTKNYYHCDNIKEQDTLDCMKRGWEQSSNTKFYWCYTNLEDFEF